MSRLYEAFCDLAGARQERNEEIELRVKAFERYWKAYCRNAGECYYCGEREGKHESDCRNAPAQDEEDGDE